MRRIYPVLAAAGLLLASSHAFAGTSVKASIVSAAGDPKLNGGLCLGGGPINADGSCPDAISGTAQVSGKKGVQVNLKNMTRSDATTKKDLLDNTATCDPIGPTAADCYITTVAAEPTSLPLAVVVNLPTQIAKGKATIKLPFTGPLALPALQGLSLKLLGGGTYQAPPAESKADCLAVLTGDAYSGPVASGTLALIGLLPADVKGVFIPGIAFDGAITDNPCATGVLVGVAGVNLGS